MKPEWRDIELCFSIRDKFRNYSGYDIVLIKCFNEDEAEMLKGLMSVIAPDIPVRTTHLIFGDSDE